MEWFINIILMIVLGVQYYMLIVGCIFVFDTILGLLTMKKRKEKFNFMKFTKGLAIKILFYTPAVVSLWVLDSFLLNELVLTKVPIEHLVTKSGTVILLSHELSSINKHIGILRGKTFTETTENIWKGLKKLAKEFKVFQNLFKD